MFFNKKACLIVSIFAMQIGVMHAEQVASTDMGKERLLHILQHGFVAGNKKTGLMHSSPIS